MSTFTTQSAALAQGGLHIALLGPPLVMRAERVLSIPRRQARALLYRLAIRLQPVAREHLCFLFWPNQPEADARRALSRLLNHVRRALPVPGALLASDDAIALNPECTWSDTVAFDRLCVTQGPARRPEALQQAVDLSRGPFLSGFSLPDTPEFETWAAVERNTYESLYLEALKALVEAHTQRRDYAAAIAYAERYLATDELAEEMHRHLILLCAMIGDRSAAVRQFERCAVILDRELNVGPLPGTRAAYQAVMDGRPPAELTALLLAAGEQPGTQPASLWKQPARKLPARVTSFVGREREMAEVERLLSDTRLLTLTGAGGSGKTRLALELAAGLLEAYQDNVLWVELAGLSDPALVPQAVASALGVREQPGRTLIETLSDQLRPNKTLLLLDNCEHLVGACAHLAEALLRACPRLRILATSREALGIVGEIAWLVPSLSLPDLGQPVREDRVSVLTQFEAIRLFVERAAAALPGFALTPQNAAAVAQVCRRLDGLPLAIELAAARLKVLAVQQMAQRLDDVFRLLTSGSRTALPRHQTLQAAMDWSFDLLPEQERAVFRRLAVFAGGFTLEATEAVCAGGVIGRGDILDLLTQLVNKSLVVVERQGEAVRYRLLETVRQYAFEKLAECGEMEQAQNQHLDFFMKLAEEAEPELIGPDQAAWLSRFEAEKDNLRAALAWSLAGGEAQAGLRLAGALWTFWDVHCHLSEGRHWLDRLLTRTRERTPVRAKALAGAGRLAQRQGTYAAARSLSEASVALYRELNDRKGLAQALENLGWVVISEGAYAESRAFLQQSLAIGRELGDKDCITYALLSLGELARIEGDDESAGALYGESLALAREAGHKIAIAVLLNNSAYVALHRGDQHQATALFKEGLSLSRELGRQNGVGYGLLGFAVIASVQARPERAARLFGAAKAVFDAIDVAMDPAERAEYDRSLSAVRAQLGETSFARAWAEGQAMSPEQAVAYALEQGPRRAPSYATLESRYPAGLTTREVEVLGLVAKGLTDAQVAGRLVISPRTVSTHLTSIYRKLGVTMRGEAVRFALAHGLL